MSLPNIDPNALTAVYKDLDSEELLRILADGAAEYERVALQQARAELVSRGMSSEEIEGAVAEGLDARGRAGPPSLPRWMFWICLIESGTFSLWILFFLLYAGRRAEANEGIFACVLGWAWKVLLWSLFYWLG